MLSFNPDLRPTIDNVMDNPWVSGPLPNEDEIQNELTARHEQSKKGKNEEEQKKKSSK